MRTKNIFYSDMTEFDTFIRENLFLNEPNLLVQVFTSELDANVLKKLLQEIQDILPQAVIVGSTTDGEILGDKVTTDKIVVSVSAFEKATLSVAMALNEDDSYSCGQNLAKQLVGDDTKILILFSDGLGINGEFFLNGVSSVSKDIPIAGGMAGDGANFKNTYVLCNNGITSSGAVGVAINAQKLYVNTTYSFFWQEIGKELTITKAKDNRVYEIDGMSAVDMYARYLGGEVASLLPATGIEFPLIITRNGVKIARAVVGKEKDGSLIFAGNLEVGDKVHFGYGNSNMILKESVKTREVFSSSPVESIFIYSCMARRRFLEDNISIELMPLSSLAPTSGFFTYGEFFKEKECEFLNQTMTVLALSESDNVDTVDYDYNLINSSIREFSATQKALAHLIQETSSELKETNDNLEQLVELKTMELQEKILELENASKVKSNFLANMSHEVRTPLNAILGFVDVLMAEETDKNKLSRFSIIKSSGDTLLSVINDILDFSKIESGKMSLEKRKFAIKEPFREVGHLFFDRAKEDGITLKINFATNLPSFFIGDIVRIKQVASNFLSNAIKFTPKEGIILMSVEFDDAKSELIFKVKDNGIGIEKKNLEKIFESFSQEDETTTRKFGGTGLGLSISSALIHSMNGHISVSSTFGKGSEFSFHLPTLEVDNLELSKDNTMKKIDINRQLNAKVLLVEDNKTNQMLMDIVLDDIGIDTDLAENGQEAVDLFKVNKYDLILMDENMPIMNGIEATKIILDIESKEGLKHTPIVALTANALATDREKFLNAGMDEFVSKPIDHEFFVRVLHSFLIDE